MWFLASHQNEPFAYLDKFFTADEISLIHAIGDKRPLEQSSVTDVNNVKVNTSVRESLNSWIEPTVDSEWLFRKLTDAIITINNRFFQYELTGFDPLQYTVYNSKVKGYYGGHIDYGFDMFVNRKLSFSVQLTDPKEYKGGELMIYDRQKGLEAPKDAGTIIFFPSFMFHEVKPVTKGTRHSLVGWILGPRFK